MCCFPDELESVCKIRERVSRRLEKVQCLYTHTASHRLTHAEQELLTHSNYVVYSGSAMAYDRMLWLIYLTSKVGRWKFLWTAVPGYRPQQLLGKFPLAQVVCLAGISVEPQSLKAETTRRDQNALPARKRGEASLVCAVSLAHAVRTCVSSQRSRSHVPCPVALVTCSFSLSL